METSISVRKNQDYSTLMEQFSILNIVTGSRQFPTDKRQLCYNASGIRKHAYCGKCRRSLGRLKNLLPGTTCCGVNITKKNGKCPVFCHCSTEEAIQAVSINSTPGARERLLPRENRQKLDPDAEEDIIYDAQGYKRLQVPNDFVTYFQFWWIYYKWLFQLQCMGPSVSYQWIKTQLTAGKFHPCSFMGWHQETTLQFISAEVCEGGQWIVCRSASVETWRHSLSTITDLPHSVHTWCSSKVWCSPNDVYKE